MKSECEKEEPEMARGKNISNVEERMKKKKRECQAMPFFRGFISEWPIHREWRFVLARIFTTRRVYFFFVLFFWLCRCTLGEVPSSHYFLLCIASHSQPKLSVVCVDV